MRGFICALFVLSCLSAVALAGDVEFTGKFDAELAPDIESATRITFKYLAPEKLKGQMTFGADAHASSARLYDPLTDSLSITAVLIEEKGKNPIMFIDLNKDKNLSDNEKFTFPNYDPELPGLYEMTLKIPFDDKTYTSMPFILRYFKGITTSRMAEGDRLLQQSQGIYARGTVNVKGKNVLVQYDYDLKEKQVNPTAGDLGIDVDGDGKIDMDSLSPEYAKVDGEAAIFRLGDTYVSTKKADLKKNLIILREHQAKDYKRVELSMGNTMPEFEFVDFKGKKRKFSEFRGKYVLLDIWGFWCPACRDELPYLKEAFRKFQGRNLEIIGLNTDPQPPEVVKKIVEQNGMNWTHATFESVVEMLGKKWMITSFPTTLLISPEGKILSRSRTDKDEPDLRQADLLETLDEILPEN